MRAGARRRASVFALGAVLLGAAREASAASPARLVYVRGTGAEACPDEQGIRQIVASHLGRDPFVDAAPLTVLVEMARDGGRFTARLRLIDRDGAPRGGRHIDTRGDCTDLVRALALDVSLALDPLDLPHDEAIAVDATPPTPSPARSPAGIEAPLAVASPTRAVAPAEVGTTQPPASRALRPFVGVGVLGGLGMAPAPSIGADLFAGIAWPRLSLELDARIAPPITTRVPLGIVRSGAVLGVLVPCVRFGAPFVCAAIGVGSVHASGDAGSRGGDGRFGAAGVRTGLELALGDTLRLRASVEILAIVGAPSLTVRGQEAYAFSPITADAGIGIVARFP